MPDDAADDEILARAEGVVDRFNEEDGTAGPSMVYGRYRGRLVRRIAIALRAYGDERARYQEVAYQHLYNEHAAIEQCSCLACNLRREGDERESQRAEEDARLVESMSFTWLAGENPTERFRRQIAEAIRAKSPRQ